MRSYTEMRKVIATDLVDDLGVHLSVQLSVIVDTGYA